MNTKTKKVFSIIGFAVLAIIVLAVLVFAIVPKSYMPDIKLPGKELSGIMFEVPDNSAQKRNVQAEDYDEFVNKYQNAFKQTMLTDLFSGILFKSPTVSGPKKSEFSPSFTGYKLIIFYNDPQTLKVNGKDYYYGGSQNPVTYKFAYLDITETNSFSTVNIYILTEENSKDVYYVISTYANFSELYKFGDKIVKGE